MKCRLCDRPTATGTGKLCTDCTKALQRARGAALSKLPPSAATEATTATPITLTVAPPLTPAPRSNRIVLWAGIGLSTLALVFFAQQELAPPRSTQAPGTSRSPLPALTERVNVEPSPVVTRVEEPSWTAVGDAAKTLSGADGPQSAAAASTAKVPVAPAGSKTGGRTAKAASQDVKSMPLPAEHDAAAPKAAETEAQHPLAAGKAAAPTQPEDGAQVLASAMQKCGSEGGFSKFICEQKTYYAYCEDKWDKDPKCMRKTAER